ncbi:winged helix-turn-helix domain-containing protein [Brevibacillus daliensis]|uniref:winged helix-turn-helix domain-containing protein n=1 Tax=Brevibacillus daliensis TaxID=2892995 RepID=UPI001E2CFADC|nr:helix-turn-helix domain-containing protein [Brevibacillus daliensis]
MVREVFEITDPDALKSFTVPERVKILQLFEDLAPRTAKQIATELGENAARLHYHVKELVKVGLLQQVDTRVKGSIIEKYYQPIAKVITANLRLVVEENAQQLSEIMFSPLRATEQELVHTLNHLASIDLDTRKHYQNTFAYNYVSLHLNKEERNELVTELKKVFAKYKDNQVTEDRLTYKSLQLLFPTSPHPKDPSNETFVDED